MPFEPYDELALVDAEDHDLWHDQPGGPRDPQPGNIGGVQRDDTGEPATSQCACDFAAADPRREAAVDGRRDGPRQSSRDRHSASSSRPARRSTGRTRSRTSRRTRPQTAERRALITTLIDDNGTPAEPGRRLPPGLRRRRHRRQRPARRRRDVDLHVAGRRRRDARRPTAPYANTVTVEARCVTTGVPGCVSGTTVADTAVNRVTGSGRRHPDQEGDQRRRPAAADARRGSRLADRAGPRRRRRRSRGRTACRPPARRR